MVNGTLVITQHLFMKYQPQVQSNHYSFERYFDESRWMSYWYQIKEIVSRPEIKSVLDIGPGTEFLRSMLAIHRPDIMYHTLDIANDVKPDIIGEVINIPVPYNTYDLVCAFQILEHIEFSDFEKGVQELKRVSKQYVFISLPHFGPSVELWFKIPFFKRVKLSTKIPIPQKHVFGGQHYWEVGKRGYSPKKIRSVLQKHLTLLDEYVPFENQYHHFYITKI
jgi:SAM-dependent methyltransferase